MKKKGLIVSVQGWSWATTEEIIRECKDADMIRTDRRVFILSSQKIIGLIKDYSYKYYITPTIIHMKKLSWADYVAIDARKDRKNLLDMICFASQNKIKLVADIECIEDAHNIVSLCTDVEYNGLSFFATTFSKKNIELVKELKNHYKVPVIAEGGYSKKKDIKKALKYGADYICIGEAITGVDKLTKKYVNIIKG